MGTQICFYLTNAEENDFIKEMFTSGYRIATYEQSIPGQLAEIKIDSNFDEELNNKWLLLIVLDKTFENQSFLKIDSCRDKFNNIEFSRSNCNFDKKTIRHGRIYLNTWHHKNEVCYSEYEKLKKLIKRKLDRYKSKETGLIYASSTIIEKIKNSELKISKN